MGFGAAYVLKGSLYPNKTKKTFKIHEPNQEGIRTDYVTTFEVSTVSSAVETSDIHKVLPKQVWLELTQGDSTRIAPHGCNGPRTVAYDDGLLVTVQLRLHEGQPDALSSCN